MKLFVLTHNNQVLGVYPTSIQAKLIAVNGAEKMLKWIHLTDEIQVAFKNPQIPWGSYRITKIEVQRP